MPRKASSVRKAGSSRSARSSAAIRRATQLDRLGRESGPKHDVGQQLERQGRSSQHTRSEHSGRADLERATDIFDLLGQLLCGPGRRSLLEQPAGQGGEAGLGFAQQSGIGKQLDARRPRCRAVARRSAAIRCPTRSVAAGNRQAGDTPVGTTSDVRTGTMRSGCSRRPRRSGRHAHPRAIPSSEGTLPGRGAARKHPAGGFFRGPGPGGCGSGDRPADREMLVGEIGCARRGGSRSARTVKAARCSACQVRQSPQSAAVPRPAARLARSSCSHRQAASSRRLDRASSSGNGPSSARRRNSSAICRSMAARIRAPQPLRAE